MLSTTSGFTQDQVQRFRSMFHLLIVGVVILIFGLGILCFGRMYTFDSSNYDLFLVFGVIIVVFATVTIVVPVYCQLRIYLQVRWTANAEGTTSGDYGPVYAKNVAAAPLPPYGIGSTYQHHAPFSTATYMMGRQQQQQQQPMAQRFDIEGSLASDDTMKQQSRRLPVWPPSDKQQPM